MENIGIVTDIVSIIPEELAKENNIKVVPLYLGFGDELYKEGEGITREEIYKKLLAGEKIYTSIPSVGDFAEVYRNLIEKEKKTLIYSIHFSSRLSGTYSSAVQAQKLFPDVRIKVIDSKHAASSFCFIVLEAARAVKRGENEKKIDAIINRLIEESSFYATFDNFEYIVRGGRAPFLSKFLGKSIVFKPIVYIDSNSDGKLKLKKFVRNKKNSITELYRLIKKVSSNSGKRKIGICYGNDIGPALDLKKMVEDDTEIEIGELIIESLTPVMSIHTGPGIWGISSCPVL